MNLREGARRMKKAGLWLTVLPLALVLFLIGRDAYQTWRQFSSVDVNPGLLELLALAVPGVGMLLLGWIVDGFAEENRQIEAK